MPANQYKDIVAADKTANRYQPHDQKNASYTNVSVGRLHIHTLGIANGYVINSLA